MHSTLSEHISLLPKFWLNRMFQNLLTSIVMLRDFGLGCVLMQDNCNLIVTGKTKYEWWEVCPLLGLIGY
jgi:hypothetical protein